MRTIDADALEARMYHDAFETDTDMQRWDSGCWIRYKLFEEILKKQPTADVRENVHGEWAKICWKAFRCSECKSISEYYTDFCPNCGADMRKEVEE